MIKDNKIWIANTDSGDEIFLLPQMANRHGLIAGATGSGKTITLKVLAESFSDLGVPVFLADIKGDIAGMINPGIETEDMKERIKKFKLDENNFHFQSYPTVFWDLFGKQGIPARTTITEMGPVLLSRILGLNDLQSDILTIIFKIADDESLALIDTKDLKAMLNYVAEHNKEYAASYGNISKVSVSAIIRAIVAIEITGAEEYFSEPALDIRDWLSLDTNGRGTIHILDSSSLINNSTLYSIFLLWLMSELFETLPEVGDLSKPKMVFFFDEAHLLFKDSPKILLEKIEQLVKLIRSKGVGIYFITQNPRDIPDGVLAQLGNKIQHTLHAYTPADRKSVKAVAESFRENPAFDTTKLIESLGTGEAAISLLQENGSPSIVEKGNILPPQSQIGSINDDIRSKHIKGSLLYSKYHASVDPDSAYELLERIGLKEKEIKELQSNEKVNSKKKKSENKVIKSVGNTIAGTVGREAGKTVGKNFGNFGKTLGGNIGAQLCRGILSTLFKG